MQPSNFINISDASTTLVQVGANSAPVFSGLLPIALIGVGFIVGGLLVAFFMEAIKGAFANAVDMVKHRK